MSRADDLRRLIALAEQLRGPLKDQVQQVQNQVQNAVSRRSDPAIQLERKRARLARRRAWAARWATWWALITAICALLAVFAFTGMLGDDDPGAAAAPIIIGLIAGTFAIRSTLRMRRLNEARAELGPSARPAPVVTALPPKSSLAREPMERLAAGEATLTELLTVITRSGSVPAESVEHTRRTGAEAAIVLRRVAAQLHAVERARDHSPPLERGPLADAVRALRRQLDEGVDGYGSLVAAAGRVLAASSLGSPNQGLTEATDHLAGLAVALKELSPDG